MGSSSSSKYDVFLSFRGMDTRRTFVSHLCRSLNQKGIRTYKDGDEQTGDGRISPELTNAIRESKIAVVVVSQNYTSSVGCLNILTKITEAYMNIIPVFYEVDPKDMIRPVGKTANDLWRHGVTEYPETVNRWGDALRRLEGIDHRFCSLRSLDDSHMLDSLISEILRSLFSPISPKRWRNTGKYKAPTRDTKITLRKMIDDDTFYEKLASSAPIEHTPQSLLESGETGPETYEHEDASITETGLETDAQEDDVTDNMSNESPSSVNDDSNGFIGMDHHQRAVYELLDLESKNQVRTVGIWGEGGVGKTTLVECIFEDISSHFQHHCFLTNVNEIYQNRISPSLLELFTSKRAKTSSDVFDAIKPTLVNRNILLVVDGVDVYSKQFRDTMKVTHWLGPGSRVIMTSEHKSSLVSNGVKYIYEMQCLRYDEALQVFSQFAFNQESPLVGFERFSVRAVHFAGHLPLALKVLGSFLSGKDKESWKSILCRLEASLDNGTRWVSSYIEACEYRPRDQINSERYVCADEGEYSPTYHMLL